MDKTLRQERLDLPLEDKIAASKAILAEAIRRFGRDFWLAWTGAKDSTLVLWLTRRACAEESLPMPRVLTIDEGDPFPEVTAFQERLTREWGLDRTIAANREVLGKKPGIGDYIALAELSPESRAEVARTGFTGPGFPFDPESPVGNQLMKVAPMNAFLRDNQVAALATAIRWDEHPARAEEEYESPRHTPPHLRIHPILHMREADVWEITLTRDIPFCELYRRGYRSLGTRHGTVRQSDKPAWEQDLSDRSQERAGRDQEKEEAMEQLRSLGYM
ncbi:MAG: phosphoadenosine phosphosulfate reductase family protein [Solidesulfovibrio sp.]|jgi:phosphoadenosine phosphosulfate reductase|uniref:phosphoadenosine phosphosulfate reductase family protein n=1 Tax=Solidesulfovibrio sp. TaxID=2910990 RepID=UPI002B21EBBC|nr:phosphoadenosine phosphosulfate reductase family protein [Solidesulfovibrio sp.]MEA4855575.1 phosphoadenosine phosphosulfate reductase family protein [Solidesulfovibrio sp.]